MITAVTASGLAPPRWRPGSRLSLGSRHVARRGEAADDRFRAAAPAVRCLRKIFPDHWSFLLGEIALYTFVILLLTGTILTLWFQPSMTAAPGPVPGGYGAGWPLRGRSNGRRRLLTSQSLRCGGDGRSLLLPCPVFAFGAS